MALVLAALALANYHTFEAGDKGAARKVFEVRRMSFSLKVIERGVIRPAQVVPIKSKISSNQAQIVWMYEEGQPVNKGLIVARFDTKPFMDRLVKAQQELLDAKASYAAAIKILELQKEQETAKIEAAKRKLEIARIKAQDVKEGSGRLKRKKLEQQVLKAERAYAIARDELADFELLLEKGYVSKRERDKVANDVKAAREALELAQADLKNFDLYEWPKLLREAQLAVEAEETNLARVRRTAELEIQRREGEVEKYRRKVESAKERVERAERDVENCDVRAPIDGTLLYVELPRADGRRKIQIGDQIWFGQTFMEIPDTSGLVVEIHVREVDVAKLRAGMPATIRVDALPDEAFQGKVIAIDPLAEENKAAHLREFRAKVRLDAPSDRIHVGMSATVEIPYRRVEHALAVPVAAVSYFDGKPFVSVELKDGSVQARPVAIGAAGVEWIEVLDGLREGERVVVQAL